MPASLRATAATKVTKGSESPLAKAALARCQAVARGHQTLPVAPGTVLVVPMLNTYCLCGGRTVQLLAVRKKLLDCLPNVGPHEALPLPKAEQGTPCNPQVSGATPSQVSAAASSSRAGGSNRAARGGGARGKGMARGSGSTFCFVQRARHCLWQGWHC